MLQRNGYYTAFVQRHSIPRLGQSEEQTACIGLSDHSLHPCDITSLVIDVTYLPFRILKQELVHPTSSFPESKRKRVDYSIPRSEFKQTYIGQTGRSLDHHCGEQFWALKNGDVMASAVAQHVCIASHQIDQYKSKVVDAHPLTRIGLDTSNTSRPLNRGTMPGFYASLLV